MFNARAAPDIAPAGGLLPPGGDKTALPGTTGDPAPPADAQATRGTEAKRGSWPKGPTR